MTGEGIVAYFDRGEIGAWRLRGGGGLEIAWLAGKVDAFFIHVQGAARLYDAGRSMRRAPMPPRPGIASAGRAGPR